MFFLDLFVEFFKENPALVITNLLFMLLMPINEVVLPHFYGKLIESIQKNNQFQKYFILTITLVLVVQILTTLGDWHDTLLNPKFQEFIRNHMLAKIFVKYETNLEDITTGDIITKFVKAPSIFISWFSRFKDYLVPYTLVFLCASCYFLYYDIVLGLSLIITISSLIYLLLSAPYHCRAQTIEKSRLYSEIHEYIDDILRNLMSVYGTSQEKKELSNVADLEKQFKKSWMDTMMCILKYKIISVPLVITFFGIFVYRSNTLIQTKRMKTSSFVSLFMILLYLVGSLMWVIDIMRDIIFDWGMVKETETQLEKTIEVCKNKIENVQPPASGIGLYDITFKYPKSDIPILENFSLHFPEGKKTVLVGDIGSGKSTVLKLLMKYNCPQSGDMYVNGKWYSDISTWNLRKMIEYVPQQPILFNRSIIDNIKYGNNNITEQDIISVVHELGIEHEFSKFSEGLYSMAGKNGSNLSGGQRQLVWCLRVMLSKPEILILDEPTSALDEKTKDLVFKILSVLMKNKTVIMVTHDPYLLKIADRVVHMKNGKVIGHT
jgi:ABC-type multidrug transport system fused ATPase/permease subunit